MEMGWIRHYELQQCARICYFETTIPKYYNALAQSSPPNLEGEIQIAVPLGASPA